MLGEESGDANVAGLSRYEGLNRALTSSGLKHLLARLVPLEMKQRVLKWYYHSEAIPALTGEERKELQTILEEVISARQA